MTLVAISAPYGAAGSRIGPAVADRLGVPFVDRAIALAVAERLDVSVDEAAAHDEQVGGSWIERMLSGFIGGDSGAPAPVPADIVSSEDFRLATEEVLRRQAAQGRGGVILGRGAVIVLRETPGALRVRLGGPRDRRIAQAMALEGLDRETAERALDRLDRLHAEYAQHFYGADLADPLLYHLVIDSTAVPIATSVELIVTAAGALRFSAARVARNGAA